MKEIPLDLYDRLHTYLDTFPPDSLLICAYSGGLDSTVLLHMLSTQDFPLLAVYVNHSIRSAEEQEQELLHVQQQCARFGVRLVSHTVAVKAHKGNIEDNARRLRYACLEDVAREHGSKAIFLAQHQDDQIETLLLQLFRSGSISALAAMQAKRGISSKHSDIVIYRPFLDTAREDLEHYATAQSLTWIEDSSNADIRYSRNYIRHQLIPLITERFPASRTSITRLAKEAQELLATLDDKLISTSPEGVRIERSAFAALSTLEKVQVLRKAMSRLFQQAIPTIHAIKVAQSNEKNNTNGMRNGKNTDVHGGFTDSSPLHSLNFRERFSKVFFAPILSADYTLRSGTKDDIGGTIILKGQGVCFLLYSDYILCRHIEKTHVSGYFFCVSSKDIHLSVHCSGEHTCIHAELYALKYTAIHGRTVIIRSPLVGDHIVTQQGERSVSGIIANVPLLYRGLVPVIEDEHGVVAVLASLFGGRSNIRPENSTELLRIQTNQISVQ